MVRFSCFNGNNQSHKSKKTVRPSFEAYHKSLQDSSRDYSLEVKMSPSPLSPQGGSQISNGLEQVASTDRGAMSEDVKSMDSNLASKTGQLKKSQSLGSGLYQDGNIEDDTDQGFSCDDSNEQNGFQTREGSNDREGSSPDNQKAPVFDSLRISCDDVNNEYVSSNPDQQHSDKEMQENYDDLRATPLLGIVKSRSLSNLSPSSPNTECYARIGRRSRSFDDSMKEIEKRSVQSQVEDDEDNIVRSEKNDTYDSRHYSGFSKDWIVPVMENVELPNKNFKNKRIEEWVNDLQHCSQLEESDEPLDRDDTMKGDSSNFGGLGGAKKEDKVSPGMLAAKRYISSLSAAASTAQLANHGLTVIPFFSAFVSLRVLNLSGNAIARITAGSLPRGLHTLNLSKNSISVIEGLRELTRLRVLDLSYNRILRIGHGLASCSALKELYLAGNKISEVEGLHRLLKLTVLDLRFNKISTSKCLGQLAANYSSLQAVSLEGNPAQKNVGDDHLRKHLQGLLPHLAYFNRQAIKMSILKDSSERAVRLGTGSLQADRSLRPDRKGARRGGRAAEPPKGRHGRLPPAGSKAGGASRLHHHVLEFGSRIRDLKQDFSMRRSRSEGTLGAL